MKQKIFGVPVAKLTASFGQTIYMVGLSLFFGAILGILLALVLVLCRKGGLKENRIVYGIVSTFVNIVRSVPFVILIVTIMPLTRAIMGTTIGSTAALVPLIFYISPYMARLVENSLLEVSDGIIEAALKKVVEPMGHEVVNYGMYAADDAAQLTYVQCGILAAILLNSGAADYVITGCGTGEGAMLALNSFPGVICGHVEDPVDAYTFAHVNDGNAVAMPFAKGFGWGGELNLEYCFEKLFGFGHGQGYPKERVEPEQRNKKILDGVRAVTFKPLIECLQSIDQDLLKGAVAGEKFSELFFASCKDDALAAYIKTLL